MPSSRPLVAIVGLGQIGGSLAAALRKRKLARVVGVSRRARTVARARRMRIVDEAGTDLEAVREADVVVLATPVRTLLRQIPRVVPLLRPGALLTDVGSTKQDVLRAYRRARPRCAVVGGHPMAGNERAGLDGCDPGLFEGRPWVLIRCTGREGGRLERLVRGVGARPLWMKDPEEHDLAVARISHVPYLLAYALADQPDGALAVAGNSFRDATRVALSDPEMVLDFLLTNRSAIRAAAAELERRFRRIVQSVARGEEGNLRALFRAARARREKL